MMVLVLVIGGFSVLVGLYLLWLIDFLVGGMIVFVVIVVFLVCWLVVLCGLFVFCLDCIVLYYWYVRVVDDIYCVYFEVGLYVIDLGL